MKTDIQEYYQSFQGKRVVFCGIGVSHQPLIEKIALSGALVTACDKRSREQLGDLAERYEAMGVTLVLGDGYMDHLQGDLIFRTPGIHYNHPALVKAREQGIPVTSEMEEFFKLCPATIFAITGSDGKTTSTAATAELLKTTGKKVFLGGNIGTPLLPVVDEMTADDYAVVELSSFQLMSMTRGPKVAVVTNVTPNHLDVHKDMQEYMDAKKNVFLHQEQDSKTVLNLENDVTRAFGDEVVGECAYFSHLRAVENGCYLRDNTDIVLVQNGQETVIMRADEIRLPGAHNVQNYMGAFAAVAGYVTPENMKKVAVEFGGVEHRIEFVRELKGVRYYNDSIATSPTRAIAGLNSFEQKQIIIAGGYDKHIPFEPFAERAVEKIKLLILTGDTAEAIETCVKQQEAYDPAKITILRAESMEQAVQLAYQSAVAGDIVSLSPACASFDRYPNFAVRGRHYKELVNALK
ncbi:MAG: UDP-N-acetylmuramoyl-L-alanine--D-glutamate ligase [Clostridia bacterium]|nr:UDP-N-acetylmuramoyl-L-alanine--D-glutamate ligase [Clostridia bacterium]